MKPVQFVFAALIVICLMTSGCATTNRTADVSGEWRWVCCSGKYWGEMKLSQHGDNRVVGNLHDTSDSRGGTLEGTVTGNYVQLTRSFYGVQQQMKMALSSNGRTLNGTVTGTVDGTDWAAAFEAHRK